MFNHYGDNLIILRYRHASCCTNTTAHFRYVDRWT